jgi:hypothetical protein
MPFDQLGRRECIKLLSGAPARPLAVREQKSELIGLPSKRNIANVSARARKLKLGEYYEPMEHYGFGNCGRIRLRSVACQFRCPIVGDGQRQGR